MQAAIQTDIEAGGNQDTDNEGAIDTGDQSVQEDNSGAAPVIGGAISGEDNSGAAPVMPGQPGQQQQQPIAGPPRWASTIGGLQTPGDQTPGWTPADVGQGVKSGMKSIVSYLMGADAAHPQALDQAGQQVDPQGQMSPGDRNLVAIDKAAETGGQEAAWKLLQANRVAFNAKQAFARTALHGIQGKPADINAAIDAANQAEQHIPDGSNVRFARSQGGVTATVTMPGTSQAQQIQLTPEQFDKWLDVGGEGQWDKVHQNSVPATLQRLSQSGGAVTGVPAGQTSRPKTNVGKTPSSINLSGSDEQQAPAEDKTNYGAELEARAMRMFPGITQENQRNQWMSAQEEKELARQNTKDVENIKGTYHVEASKAIAGGRVDAAKLYSGAKRDTAMAMINARLQQIQGSNANQAETRALKLAQTYILSGQSVPPELQQHLDKVPGMAALADQTLQGQQTPAPQQAAPAQTTPPPAQRQVGHTVTTSKGTFKWNGTGWDPVK